MSLLMDALKKAEKDKKKAADETRPDVHAPAPIRSGPDDHGTGRGRGGADGASGPGRPEPRAAGHGNLPWRTRGGGDRSVGRRGDDGWGCRSRRDARFGGGRDQHHRAGRNPGRRRASGGHAGPGSGEHAAVPARIKRLPQGLLRGLRTPWSARAPALPVPPERPPSRAPSGSGTRSAACQPTRCSRRRAGPRYRRP
jgi:hypothetical protein